MIGNIGIVDVDRFFKEIRNCKYELVQVIKNDEYVYEEIENYEIDLGEKFKKLLCIQIFKENEYMYTINNCDNGVTNEWVLYL